ncbi:hypothetical protein F5Y12DRAFT_426686 [Xylaria sp. FL1777]|nr:hypothetical protein F5Y12DRAFT_426686 [Xylaria sp. FL1777]
MPSRINLPKLSLFSSRNSSSSSTPASKMLPPPASKPNSNVPPVSPPARLHLRNILPASPEEPPIMPPPPRTPRAWVWQCHRCLNVYRLGCTRRCLDCSHTYCISNPQGSRGPKKKKRRRETGLCGAEFDYVGWEQWGSWRRKVLGHEAAGRCETKARDRAFLKKRHDCWIDCDSPSECCHRRYELAAEALRKQKQTPAKKSGFVPLNRPLDPDNDDLPITEALGSNGEGEEPPPKSPLGQSSFLWDEDEGEDEEKGEKTKEEMEEEEKKWWAAGRNPAPDSAHNNSMSSSTARREPPGVDSHDWESAIYDERSDSQERPAKGLTARNLTGDDIVQEGSDSDSESDGSGWSTNSSESDDSSVGTGAGVKLP